MDLTKFLEPAAVVIATLGVLVSLISAMRAGIIKRLIIGPLTLEGSADELAQARALISVARAEPTEQVPFETEQLARYYAQVLAQSKISFWFSLFFASLGFLVIVIAAFMYSQDRQGSTIASFIAGSIIDAVAALFFVQSKNAQKAMGEFFDKLRKDRQQAESRALCENVTNSDARDALRVQLALYYAGVENSPAVAQGILSGVLGQSEKTLRSLADAE